MKRIMIDTNVYEFLLKYIERSVLEDVLFQKRLIFYGSDIIRKELREIPKSRKETIGGQLKSLRNILLSLYDFVVEKHHYKTTKQMEELADKYFIVYRTFGGIAEKKEINNDFKIVACASLNNLDILASEDIKTMLSDKALMSYASVNNLLGFKTPKFIKFKEFRNRLRGGNLD